MRILDKLINAFNNFGAKEIHTSTLRGAQFAFAEKLILEQREVIAKGGTPKGLSAREVRNMAKASEESTDIKTFEDAIKVQLYVNSELFKSSTKYQGAVKSREQKPVQSPAPELDFDSRLERLFLSNSKPEVKPVPLATFEPVSSKRELCSEFINAQLRSGKTISSDELMEKHFNLFSITKEAMAISKFIASKLLQK
ncbi:MAG: hypothetical protein KDK50_03785 [Chlamydiia bacterium]|nr:hypothetical protein [Chlamydiia bacterium]